MRRTRSPSPPRASSQPSFDPSAIARYVAAHKHQSLPAKLDPEAIEKLKNASKKNKKPILGLEERDKIREEEAKQYEEEAKQRALEAKVKKVDKKKLQESEKKQNSNTTSNTLKTTNFNDLKRPKPVSKKIPDTQRLVFDEISLRTKPKKKPDPLPSKKSSGHSDMSTEVSDDEDSSMPTERPEIKKKETLSEKKNINLKQTNKGTTAPEKGNKPNLAKMPSSKAVPKIIPPQSKSSSTTAPTKAKTNEVSTLKTEAKTFTPKTPKPPLTRTPPPAPTKAKTSPKMAPPAKQATNGTAKEAKLVAKTPVAAIGTVKKPITTGITKTGSTKATLNDTTKTTSNGVVKTTNGVTKATTNGVTKATTNGVTKTTTNGGTKATTNGVTKGTTNGVTKATTNGTGKTATGTTKKALATKTGPEAPKTTKNTTTAPVKTPIAPKGNAPLLPLKRKLPSSASAPAPKRKRVEELDDYDYSDGFIDNSGDSGASSGFSDLFQKWFTKGATSVETYRRLDPAYDPSKKSNDDHVLEDDVDDGNMEVRSFSAHLKMESESTKRAIREDKEAREAEKREKMEDAKKKAIKKAKNKGSTGNSRKK